MSGTFLYFAYGSNMLRERLVARCPSARVMGAAALIGAFELVFNKQSVDGSGKAALVLTGARSPRAYTYGVVYEIDQSERLQLDRVEADGYQPGHAAVWDTQAQKEHVALTYFARPDAIKPGLHPYDWYLALMRAGAHQNQLPADYTERLSRLTHVPDPVVQRDRRVQALACLEAAGFPFSSS